MKTFDSVATTRPCGDSYHTILQRSRRVRGNGNGITPYGCLLLVCVATTQAWTTQIWRTPYRSASAAAAVPTVGPTVGPLSASRLVGRPTFVSTPRRVAATMDPPVSNGFADEPNHNDRNDDNNDDNIDDFPILGDDGIWHIESKTQHANFLDKHRDKLVILKVFAPWCRACKGLEPKFAQLVHSDTYRDTPIVWADLSIKHNKAFVQSLGVLALPTIQFYVGSSLTDTFPCGPSKAAILKRKLAALVAEHVQPGDTPTLKPTSLALGAAGTTTDRLYANTTEASGTVVTAPPATRSDGATRLDGVSVALDNADRQRLRQSVPFFNNMNLADVDLVLDQAQKVTFAPGAVIMREGKPGRTFYVLEQGEVEICQKTMAEDPLTMPAAYLGTVINRLGPGDWFGERGLITGEPRAASIRATENVTCWTFDKEVFPFSSVLSGRTKGAVDEIETLNEKYGVCISQLMSQEVDKQLRDANTANQIRGSPNTPEYLEGIDSEEIYLGSFQKAVQPVVEVVPALSLENDSIFSLLTRFKMIRNVSRCFRYIVKTKAQWGQSGIRNRRNMLVQRLPSAQQEEFRETFQLIDASGDGLISLLELKRVMNSIGETKSDTELLAMIENSADPELAGRDEMNLQDFMGIMAEAEFYHLFRDIFSSLDTNDSGFVKARELDQVLSGVRDLISDDHRSIIDVEDKDMLIDYEQFSRMLLGTTLV